MRRLFVLVCVATVALLAPSCQTDSTVELTTPNPLPDGRVGQDYFVQILSTVRCGQGLIWSVSGGLPGGMKLSRDGALDGRPAAAGAYTFRIDAYVLDLYNDYKGDPGDSKEYSLTILPSS